MADLDCQKCGACCAGQVVILLPTDTVPIHMRDGRFMKQMNGRCVALDGRVGVSVSCSIYESRPEECSVLPAGCWACVAIRRDTHVAPREMEARDP